MSIRVVKRGGIYCGFAEWLTCNACGFESCGIVDSPSDFCVCPYCGQGESAEIAAPEPAPPVGQTRLGSMIEVATNIAVGFSVNFVANLLILPLYGFHVTGHQAFSMGLIFTVIAIVRSYLLRRVFNSIRSLHHD